jgi:hypothetical protein
LLARGEQLTIAPITCRRASATSAFRPRPYHFLLTRRRPNAWPRCCGRRTHDRMARSRQPRVGRMPKLTDEGDDLMDPISSLLAGAARARETFNDAAVKLSGADLPREPEPGAPELGPDSFPTTATVDVAEQLTTMMVSSHVHAANIAAMRAAIDTYRAAIDIVY